MVKNLTPLPPPSAIFRKPPPLKCGRGRLLFSSSPTLPPWKIKDNQTIFHISKSKSEKCCNVSCLNDYLWLPKGMLIETKKFLFLFYSIMAICVEVHFIP